MRAVGLTVDPALIETAERYAVDEGNRAFANLLERRTPTAVIAGNDMIAIGCYAALRSRGARCPADVSVVGFNDMPLSGFLDPPLTTVAIPQYDIGACAAELILGLMAERGEPVHRLLPTELMVRGSTGPPPAA
jgi:LacI family transcriptional regulator